MNQQSVRISRLVVTCLAIGGLVLGALKFWIQKDLHTEVIQTVDATEVAVRSVLNAVDSAGTRLVAVGEGGIVLLSDDRGVSWRRVATPVVHTLTAVSFADERTGLAVGHRGALLRTTDGGTTWEQVALPAEGGDAAAAQESLTLLGAHWVSAQEAVAVGAFGAAYRSTDGGRTWSSMKDVLPNPDEYHLYGVAHRAGSRFVVGELGAVIQQDASGAAAKVETPYKGTFFGSHATADALLIHGLRGTVLRSIDNGLSWTPCPVRSDASVTTVVETRKGDLLLGNMKGEILRASKGSCEFQAESGLVPGGITDMVLTDDEHIVAVGPRGVAALALVQ